MHVKYKLREAEGLVNPKGPNFSRAQTICCDFAGTVLSFKAPKHRPYTSRLKEHLAEKRYTKEQLNGHFRCYGDDYPNTPNHIEYYELFRRFWAFNGSWFTGTLAQLGMQLNLIKPVNYDHEFSLFHPRAFEKIIGDYLTYIYGNRTDDGEYNFTAPVNWQPLSKLTTLAARLEVVPNKGVHTHVTRHHLFFILNDQVLVNVRFDPSRIKNISKKELDKRVSEDSMLELMNNIIDSFQLTLSDEAKQQQQAALAGLDDMSLIKHYPPINWNEQTANQQSNPKKLK